MSSRLFTCSLGLSSRARLRKPTKRSTLFLFMTRAAFNLSSRAKRGICFSFAACLLFALPTSLSLTAQEQVSRPKITAIAYVRVFAADLNRSRDFYGKILGLTSGSAGCLNITRPCFTVNSHQRIELEQIAGGAPDNLLATIAFATSNVEQMRAYLVAHGVAAKPIARDSNGQEYFEALDPEGHPISFVQQADHFFSPSADQIGTRLFHAGFIVKDNAVEDRFYRGLLGFRMYWHGGFKDEDMDWEELQVPDGSDWIEYMLNIPARADKQERGVQNHFSLGVSNMKTTFERLRVHGLKPGDDKPEIGRDGKWSFDIYDPDLTRVEFMEYKPAQPPCCHPYEAAHPTP
jgi:catechol 2,3-dioxygenase-like lactoylglutathione lyase family enzyme